MSEWSFTEDDVRSGATAESFRRGKEYARSGRVEKLVRRGEALHAEVEGSDYEPYRVVALVKTHDIEAECTCPYEYGGWCKHIVAVLLEALQDPDSVEVQPPLEDVIQELSREQLHKIVLHLAQRNPDLYDAIAAQAGLVKVEETASSPGSASEAPPVDERVYRHRVRAALHSLDRMRSSEAYWHVSGVVREVEDLAGEAEAFLKANDGRRALTVLKAVTDEYMQEWETLDDSDGEASSFFEDMAPVWVEAILTADLSKQERKEWANTLNDWQRELEDYGVDSPFDAAITAAQQGWDDLKLVRVLRGQSEEPVSAEGSWSDRSLIEARLNVLERQERYEEALRLARVEGQTARYCGLLIRLGRIGEAVEYSLRHLNTTSEILFVAQALQENGATEDALRVAAHGLTVEDNQGVRQGAELAVWLRDLATEQGDTELALRAAVVAARQVPSLHHYRCAGELAGEQWPALREEVLDNARRHRGHNAAGAVEIFLHERLFDDALNAIESHWDYNLIARVAEAAATERPERVIPICRKQAEQIMNGGKSEYYGTAVEWLKIARTAYLAAGRESEWKEYLAGLVEQHKKKYKLRPMLEKLRS